ncbi:MAG: hypothetical protein EBZ06_06625 [Betaproteobacteria bacterium]|nr:hypothetical protein [Betaproteobacteria bacterium]NBO44837.1 hypothetical protein [Betaproteobacteria bacterium]NBS21433.1 hypothetical protein [Betaproteobacteria bacterium]NBT64802.1 hypothetical protein [Betaproteobacteria bacterium]NBU67061.1 hypothetical protein [Betaproteobacteria bacterium]
MSASENPSCQSDGRRRFGVMMLTLAAPTLPAVAFAQAPMLSETDAQAASLGYRADATKVDKAKYPRYAAGQLCVNCTLYQGKPDSAAGGCSIFPGKQVAGKGWCSAYNKKAA